MTPDDQATGRAARRNAPALGFLGGIVILALVLAAAVLLIWVLG